MKKDKSFTERMRKLRLLHNWEIKDVADKLDMSYAAYRRIEQGDVNITMENLAALSQLYDLSMDFIATGQPFNSSEGQRMQRLFEGLEGGDGTINEPEVAYQKIKKPVRIVVEVDPDLENEELPIFLHRLKSIIRDYNEASAKRDQKKITKLPTK